MVKLQAGEFMWVKRLGEKRPGEKRPRENGLEATVGRNGLAYSQLLGEKGVIVKRHSRKR